MKDTGITRQLDQLGRVVIPKELRDVLNIANGDSLGVFVDGETIILQKYSPGCFICGEITGDLENFKGKLICEECKTDLTTHA